MERRQSKVLLYCLLMCIASSCVVYYLLGRQQKKIAVIDAVKLVNGYNMKKELEEMDKVRLQAESKQLDSIANFLRMAKAVNTNDEEVKKIAYQYDYMKTKLDNDYTQSNRDINEQVWKRLNPALDEYGKKKGFHLIIGANGMGSVLYTDNYYDVTDEAIKYVNEKYAQGN